MDSVLIVVSHVISDLVALTKHHLHFVDTSILPTDAIDFSTDSLPSLKITPILRRVMFDIVLLTLKKVHIPH